MLKKDKLEIIHRWYPNAITTIDIVNKVIDFIEETLELELGQVMIADSICGDDVNSIQYPARATEFLGPFKMGGLNGFPFTGLTGMKALSSHVPDNGAVFIFYGPHIGISKTGKIGEIQRFGQSKPTGCCGAARAALSNLQNGQIIDGNITEMDYQINILEQVMLREKKRILTSETPLYETTEVTYEAIEKRIDAIVAQVDFHCRYVILVGSVLINSDAEIGQFASNRRFEIWDLKAGQKRNLEEILQYKKKVRR